MAELIITVSPKGELAVRSEGLTRAQWEQATAELRAVLGEPTRQVVEAEQHVHHVHVETGRQIRHGGS
jgi:predicted RNA-binding protein associated with RNAse of E/G family